MSAEPAAVVRAWFEAHEREDLEGARACFADDGVVHVVAGDERLLGDLAGFDAFMAWYAARATAVGPTTYAVDDVLAGDGRAVALLALRDADGREWKQVAIYEVRQGRIAEIWVLEGRPAL